MSTSAAAVAEVLARGWGIRGTVPEPLGGGMNSETWRVTHAGTPYVVKQVASDGLDALAGGCRVASRLAATGLRTGRPVPTLEGALLDVESRVALLEHVPGTPLTGDTPAEQALIAATLARVHHAGELVPGPGTRGYAGWLHAGAPGVADVPWLVDVVDDVRAAPDSLDLTWSLVHSDPEPGAFLHDPATGVTGLVDWAGSGPGPVLFDVASAVMYLGGVEHAGPFLTAYAAAGPLGADELAHLPELTRFRWLVQAAWFAGRLHSDDTTGPSDEHGDHGGLADARRGLARSGVRV